MRNWMRILTSTLTLIALAATNVAIATETSTTKNKQSNDPYRTVRGMTVSCPRAGQIWGTDAMVKTMAELKQLGVNWIAIHPYAHIHGDGTVGGRYMDRLYDDPKWLTRPIKEAHHLGLKIMIKPHISYWGSPFDWRGEIQFNTEQKWARFFDTYEKWITMVARLSENADAFVVGTELDATVHHANHWRAIISAVRDEFDGPLTYAANWDSYEKITFWDALDVIGIQAYFPLVDHENLPTTEELDAGWRQIINELRAYSRQHKKKILLAELGYNRSSQAAHRPWSYREGGPNAERIQKRSLDSALRAVKQNDFIVGAFLWKWFPGERQYSNFTKSTPAMRTVIREHWSDTQHFTPIDDESPTATD